MADLASRITKPDAAATSAAESSDVADAQVDGAADAPQTGLYESTFDVEVKLSDLQNDQANPLYSVSSFEELGL